MWKRARPGQEFAVLSGNPQAEGSPFVIRLRLDDGVIIPPHWHPVDEHLTILTGALYMGMGEKLDEAAVRVMPAGSYVLIPKETRHFVRAKGQTIIQIHGIGPFKTYWVDQRDEQKGKQGQ
jgi:quercetin dioxygenase-like cupin family protein